MNKSLLISIIMLMILIYLNYNLKYNNEFQLLQLSSNRIVNIPITQTVSDTLYVFDNNNEEITDLTENERDEIISFLTLSNVDVSPLSRINNIDSIKPYRLYNEQLHS